MKAIGAGKSSFATIRNSLHAGKPLPLSNKRAWLLFRWQELNALQDDCAKQLQAIGDKRKRALLAKRLRSLKRAIDAIWRELGGAWRGLSGKQLQAVLTATSEHLQRASQPPVHRWQQVATSLIELSYLLDGDDKVSSPAGVTSKLTAKQLADELRANSCTGFSLHDLRRFVRDTLQVRLADERGRRHDLRR